MADWWESAPLVDAPKAAAPKNAGANWWDAAPVVDQKPEYGGAAMNATAGANEGVYGILGAPVDLMRGAMNAGVRGVNAATGAHIAEIPEDSFGGSKWIGETMGEIAPQFDPANTKATSSTDRIARGVGQGAAATALPIGIVGAAEKAGATVSPLVQAVAGRTSSAGADAVAGAAAGGGAATASELAPDRYKPAAATVGGLIGGGVGALATAAPAAAGALKSAVEDFGAPMTVAGRDRLAAERIAGAAEDPAQLKRTLADPPAPIVEGSQPTTFQMSGDMGVGGLEREAQTKFPVEFQQRRADQNKARVDAVEGVQPTGAAETVSKTLRDRLAQIDADAQAQLQGATQAAQAGADGVGSPMVPEAAGGAMRQSLEAARSTAKQREGELWSAVDPDGTLGLSAANTTTAAKTIVKDLPASAKPPSGEEAAIYGVLGQYGDVVPFGEMTALSSRVKAEMRAERMANGETPAYRRLSQLSGAIHDDLETAVVGKVEQEAQAVARGEMAPEQTIESKWAGLRDNWLTERDARASGQDGGTSFGTYGAGRSVAVPGVSGTRSEARSQSGRAPRDPRLSRDDVEPNFDQAALDRLNAARGATRDRVATFDNPTLNPIRRRPSTTSPYNMDDARVAATVFRPGTNGFERIQTFRKAAGPDAMAAVEGYAVGSLRKAAMNEDGTLDPAKVASWRRSHADALRALPELDARIQSGADASEAMAAMAAKRKTTMDEAQKGAAGKLIGVDDPSDVSRIVGGLFGRQDAVNQFSRLRDAVRDNPEAEAGLRKAIVDHVLDRFVGNTEAATSGQELMKSDQFQTFIKRNGVALHAAGFDNDAIRTMEAVADDLQRSNRSLTAVRIPGQSNTAQDQRSILQRIASSGIENWATVAGGTMGASVGGAPGAMAGGAMAAVFNALRQNGIDSVDALVKDALLNPDRARMLLAKLPDAKPEQAESMLKALARRYTKAAIAAPLIGEKPSQKGPMRLPAPNLPDYMRPASTSALRDAMVGRQ